MRMKRSTPRPRRTHAIVMLVVGCLALLLCTPADAARTARRTARHRPPAVSPVRTVAPAVVAAPVGAAGMIVARDPETGALVLPTAEQVQKLTAAEQTGLMRTSEGLSEVSLPNGAVKLDLQGRFMEYGFVQLDATGCPHFFSVNDEIGLRALLARRAPAPTPALEEK